MMSKKPYKKSTVGHYIVRMRRIKPLDELVHDNLDAHIADYETGANSAINHSSHNVYSCALRHFKDYRYPTINGDPFANGVLRFEDQSVAGGFVRLTTSIAAARADAMKRSDIGCRTDGCCFGRGR